MYNIAAKQQTTTNKRAERKETADNKKISPVFLPLSGSEPRYNPDPWNSIDLRKSHNCYAYFLQDLYKREAEENFPQPAGYYVRKIYAEKDKATAKAKTDKKRPTEPYKCDAVTRAVLLDNPSIFKVQREVACPKHYYKGFMAVDSDMDDGDFHFWIQHNDSLWSHKPGEQPVSKLDSSGQKIRDPLLSDRGRYKTPCGYFCVPSNDFLETHSAA